MSKKLVIAEKPSVAKDIAMALEGFTTRGKVFESKDMIVCSAAGHLVELRKPEVPFGIIALSGQQVYVVQR